MNLNGWTDLSVLFYYHFYHENTLKHLDCVDVKFLSNEMKYCNMR